MKLLLSGRTYFQKHLLKPIYRLTPYLRCENQGNKKYYQHQHEQQQHAVGGVSSYYSQTITDFNDTVRGGVCNGMVNKRIKSCSIDH